MFAGRRADILRAHHDRAEAAPFNEGDYRVSKNTIGGSQLDRILDRLQNDSAFREKMLGDPAAALAEHGVDVDPSAIPAVRSLPSPSAISEQRDALKNKVDSKVGLAIFLLGAS